VNICHKLGFSLFPIVPDFLGMPTCYSTDRNGNGRMYIDLVLGCYSYSIFKLRTSSRIMRLVKMVLP